MPNARTGSIHPPVDTEFAPVASDKSAVPVPGASSPQLRQPSILLVDDDPLMLKVQSSMLRAMGYPKVTTAISATDALLQLEHDPHSADLIVCDLRMPGMDGIEFLQTLNTSPFRGSVILLSGEDQRIMHTVQKLLDGQRLRVLGTLTKPAAREALRALLRYWKPAMETTSKNATAYQFTSDELHAASRLRQWVIHYQPQVDLRTGDCIGLEALVRWQHPQHGLLYPDMFVPAAENCGAVNALTDFVVENAIAQLKIWHAQGLYVRMALNLSLAALETPGFWSRLTAVLGDSSLAPKNITLEITETRLASFSSIALENLVRLRMQHFALSIDDFGVGHSSLAQLRDVPFTELKIDRGFVTGARNNQIIRPILEGGLGIAKRMGMTSVAEGVETEDDWALIRELECDLAQGYFIGRPMSAESIWNWHSLWEARRPHLVSI
jgi:EAL domain-containing protein (putative c-di-GMP-specific phosphodiesterase class I)/DNA-binding NarL/FixJ family response regulator